MGNSEAPAGFNPRPEITHGRTAPPNEEHRDRHVSIRAPRSLTGRHSNTVVSDPSLLFQSAPRDHSRGDTTPPTAPLACCAFQSAPRDHSRGDLAGGEAIVVNALFQSAPRDHSRGDLSMQLSFAASDVSIRAPRSLTGRPR